MKHKIHSGLGSLKDLSKILEGYNVSRIMIVTGKKSFENCGAKSKINKALADFKVTYFNDFEANPKLDDAKKGVKLMNKNDIELLIAVGGGSVIDMAKLIKAFCATPTLTDLIATGLSDLIDPKIPLIAVPTTAGSGSESTHFAVVYIEKEKFSVADKCLLPDEVILDGQLILSASKYQKICSALDAISQSIESAWAVAATSKSKKLSYSALKLCMDSFSEYIDSDNSFKSAQSMIEASNLAGQAINITKTTAPHAWSYGISMQLNIPHGHSIWITLPKIYALHCKNESSQNMIQTMAKLNKIIGIDNSSMVIDFFDTFLENLDIKTSLSKDLNISSSDRKILSEKVNMERMSNNPIKFSQENINYIFDLN